MTPPPATKPTNQTQVARDAGEGMFYCAKVMHARLNAHYFRDTSEILIQQNHNKSKTMYVLMKIAKHAHSRKTKQKPTDFRSLYSNIFIYRICMHIT